MGGPVITISMHPESNDEALYLLNQVTVQELPVMVGLRLQNTGNMNIVITEKNKLMLRLKMESRKKGGKEIKNLSTFVL